MVELGGILSVEARGWALGVARILCQRTVRWNGRSLRRAVQL